MYTDDLTARTEATPTPEEVKRRVTAFVDEFTDGPDDVVRVETRMMLMAALLWSVADRAPGVVADALDQALLDIATIELGFERGGL
jgi:hypothetical protein